MKQKYILDNILITSNFIGQGSPDWDSDNLRPEYQITLTTTDNKQRYTTKAWGSRHDWENWENNRIEDLGKELIVLILEDAITDPENFSEFCANFGYDDDSMKAFKIYQQLKKAYTNGFWLTELKEKTIKKLENRNDEDIIKMLKSR
jgi:hypothetical protein